MVSLENLLLYIPLAALLVMLPGPDFALIVRTSLTEGRSSGQAAACGVALGIMVHTSAAMLGISAVIAQSVTLFTLLRYAGAAYLFWMGIHACGPGVRSRPPWCVTEGRKRKCSLSAACVAGPSGRAF